MMIEWPNVVAGLLVGVLVGLTGVGGGALMTPILVLIFGVSPSTAVGTDLWFAALTKIVGGGVHGTKGQIDWEVLRRMFYGSIPACLLTIGYLWVTHTEKSHDPLITKMMGGVLIASAVAAFFRPVILEFGKKIRLGSPDAFLTWQPALTVMGGALVGFLVTFTSIGAGAIGAVMLLYLYPLRMKPSVLVGTDIVHAIPLTIIAGLGHLLLGNVKFGLLGWLLLGSIPGIVVGSLLSAWAPQKVVRTAISIVLLLVGMKMVLT
ncbi:MAG TPA: sulfite exporter TauE/SafE family protein [Nevskiaceae bacterium]|nr:sulfite exporter TauE/SafE family protein [Nevskiaceae bacterium]